MIDYYKKRSYSEKNGQGFLSETLRAAAVVAERSASTSVGVVPDHLGDARRDPRAGRQVEELVGPVGVGARAHRAGDKELGLREALAEHAHERDRAAEAREHRRLAEVRDRCAVDRLEQLRIRRRRVPAVAGVAVGVEGDARAVRRIGL